MLPQFFIAGAPKAGTTALHAALLRHPQLYFAPVKEPKFFQCAERRPADRRGPGDAHSSREWVWDRTRYEALFDTAPAGALAGECTPFYLYDHAAQRRIAALVPSARIVALLRDPVDRAYSNWVPRRGGPGTEQLIPRRRAVSASPEEGHCPVVRTMRKRAWLAITRS